MMYSNKLAAAIKVNGKILREFKDTVYIPFGAEYTIYIKNLNSVRAKVRLTVDGEDATEDTSLVIDGGKSIDVTRYIKNGNFEKGNRFKFVERTASVERHRGIGVEDGLIRIEYEFEKVFPIGTTYWVPPVVHQYWDPYGQYYSTTTTTTTTNSTEPLHEIKTSGGLDHYSKMSRQADRGEKLKKSLDRGADYRGLNPDQPGYEARLNSAIDGYAERGIQCSAASASLFVEEKARGIAPSANYLSQVQCSAAVPQAQSEVGITVPGSISHQRFHEVRDFPCDGQTHVMVIKILGETETGHAVSQPAYVKAKPKCVTCGRVNKSSNKFCAECGTSLELV